MITLAKLSLLVATMCMVLAGWSLIQGEIHDTIFGLCLGAFLLWCWRWGLRQPR
jgi:hypothetical protein